MIKWHITNPTHTPPSFFLSEFLTKSYSGRADLYYKSHLTTVRNGTVYFSLYNSFFYKVYHIWQQLGMVQCIFCLYNSFLYIGMTVQFYINCEKWKIETCLFLFFLVSLSFLGFFIWRFAEYLIWGLVINCKAIYLFFYFTYMPFSSFGYFNTFTWWFNAYVILMRRLNI